MEVIPIPPTSSGFAYRNIRTRTFFIVDDRLDENALKNALDRLIRDHWRLLGARITGDLKAPQLTYHLPIQFTDDYELFRWTSEDSDASIEKAVPGLWPASSKGRDARILPFNMDAIDARFRPAEWPYNFKDAVDVPSMLVNLSQFSDATVLAISLPHVVGDQMGLANIISAWMGLLEGKTPPPLIGYKEDILPGQKPFSEYAKREVTEKGRTRIKSRLDVFLIPLGFAPEIVLKSKETRVMLLFPAALLQSIREKPFSEKGKGAVTELTNADIIAAIMVKLSRLDVRKKHMISVSQTVNLRRRVPELSDPEKIKGFIGNSLVYATNRVRFDHTLPLGELARQGRKSITKTVEPSNIDLYLAISREQHRRGRPEHICEPLEKSYHITNWASAWRELDFTLALEAAAKEARGGRELKVLVLGQGREAKAFGRFNAVVMCKTKEGYWIDFAAADETMAAVKRHLAKDPELEKL